MEKETTEKGFVIKDRRHFDEGGAPRDDAAKGEAVGQEERGADSTLPPADDRDDAAQERPGEADKGPLPEITFANFIFSLSTTAMYHFGDIPDPATKEPRKNLAAAKQTIDLISLLRTKTQGNLDEQEKDLIEGVLYELRMRFVKEVKK